MSSLFESLAAMSAEAQEKNQELNKLHEARRIQKAEYCAEIEGTALRLCGWINCMLDTGDADAERIHHLSAALGHAATALHAAEGYANMGQNYGSVLGWK